MSSQRQGTRHDTTTPRPKTRGSIAAGAAISITSIAPIAIGTWTVTSRMSIVPFNGSCAVFVVVWAATLLRLHETRAINREEERDKMWRKRINKVKNEIRDSHIDRLAASVERADQRGPNGLPNIRGL